MDKEEDDTWNEEIWLMGFYENDQHWLQRQSIIDSEFEGQELQFNLNSRWWVNKAVFAIVCTFEKVIKISYCIEIV